MAYLGRFMVGHTTQLRLQTRNASGTPTTPDNVPQVKIYTAAGVKVLGNRMASVERYIQTGQFALTLFLSGLFSVGTYNAYYHWTTGSQTFQGYDYDNFEIVAGGNSYGEVVAQYFFERPQARYIVYRCSNGSLVQGRNPTF